MTDEQALDYWYGLANYEKVTPQAADLRLDRMKDLMAALGNPQDRLGIVHVAGSKGKGSTSAMLAAVLQKAGYRVGLFTSPHLCRVEERIQIDGQPITQADLGSLLSFVRYVVEGRGLGPPTFFEVATAMAFMHMARREVDVAVIEVGLGGRFDATNVCTPLVAVITSISRDHTQLLGDRLESIAMEKAGIVKPGRPVVSGAVAPEARQMIETICRERGAPLSQLEIDFHYTYMPGQVNPEAPQLTKKPQVQITTARRSWQAMELGLLGRHQGANAAVAVAVIEQLYPYGFAIDEPAVRAGLAGVRWPARLEVVGARPLVVLDCAHNVASIQAFVETLTVSFPPAKRVLIFAASGDKDLEGMLRLLAPHFAYLILTRSHNRRNAPPEHLAELCSRLGGPPSIVCSTPAEAWSAARKIAAPEDLICITGSVFLAGEMRPLILAREMD
jgi:dihydrofolate synthase/folylpolyglutamate synthase